MQKLILLTILTLGTAAGLLAQGTVNFESATSTGTVVIELSNVPPGFPAGSVSTYEGGSAMGTEWEVALLWSATLSTTQPISDFTQAVVYNVTASDPGHAQGFFTDGTAITIPIGSGGGSAAFLVEAWTGNYANYAAAQAAGALVGESAEFINAMGNPNLPTPTPPVNTTGFDGNVLLLGVIPEPGTIALGGLGTAVMLLSRRQTGKKAS